MKLFIMGHKYTNQAVCQFILKNYSDIEFDISEFNMSDIDGMKQILENAEKTYDCILFTGQLPYDLMLSQMTSTIPWDFIERQEQQILTLLLNAAVVKNIDIRRISIDKASLISFPSNTMEKIYHRIGIKPSEMHISYIDGNPLDENLEKNIANQHIELYQSGTVNFCVTGISPIHEFLIKNNVPSLRIQFDDSALEKALSRLRLSHASFKQSHMPLTMAIIELYEEGSASSGISWQRIALHNKLKIFDEILALSNRLNAALIELGCDQFYMIFHNETETDADDFVFKKLPSILHFAKQMDIGIHVGIGINPVPRFCRLQAIKALQQTRITQTSSAFFCDEDGQLKGPIQPASSADTSKGPTYYSDDMIWNISHKTKIHTNIISKILSMKKHYKDGEFTSHDLANTLGISSRNANRILTKLENSGIVELAGQRFYPGGGRPLRIFRIII